MSPIPIRNTPPSIDATMVWGTMPWLMFYAGFMAEIQVAQEQGKVKLNSVAGTSAGAAIWALTAVWKAKEAPKMLLEEFEDTGRWSIWIMPSKKSWKTIQRNLKKVISREVDSDTLKTSDIALRTLHMNVKKWKGLEKTENHQYKEVWWLVQSMLRYTFCNMKWEKYWDHEVFDSREITGETKEQVSELISASFQYSPENSSVPWEVRVDWETWSRTEDTVGSAPLLNKGLSPDRDVIVLTRFQHWHKSHKVVVDHTEKVEARTKAVISPIRKLKWNFLGIERGLFGTVDTRRSHMEHNVQVGRDTARAYLQALEEGAMQRDSEGDLSQEAQVAITRIRV